VIAEDVFVAIRRGEDGEEWPDLDCLAREDSENGNPELVRRKLRQRAAGVAAGWAAKNPVVRIARARLTEIRG
jgi:hypothetical protein